MANRPVVGPQSSVNERLVALEIVRQVLTLRFSLHLRGLVVATINNTEQPMAAYIREMLRTDAGLRDPAQVRRLDGLIAQLNAMRQPAWEAGRRVAEEQLTALAEAEPEDQRDLFAFLLPGAELLLPALGAAGLGAAALARPFNGRVMRQWFDDAAQDEGRRVRQALYAGAAVGDSPAASARRVVGSASAQGRDGATQVSRNHVDTIVRSATVHVAAYARDQFYQANAAAMYVFPVGAPRPAVRPVGAAQDPVAAETARQVRQALGAADRAAGGAGRGGAKLFAQEQFVAVLDGRTTKLCRGLDGKRYALGVGPIPPLHPNCRSNRVVVLPESVGGPLYDPGTYGEWVRSQPFEVQVLLMGSTRARRLGEEDLADAAFQDYGARPMTLGQVRDEARRTMEFY